MFDVGDLMKQTFCTRVVSNGSHSLLEEAFYLKSEKFNGLNNLLLLLFQKGSRGIVPTYRQSKKR